MGNSKQAGVPGKPRASVILALWVVLLGFPSSAKPQTSDRGSVGEYQVKAAFLYHFTKFVEWPAAAANRRMVEVCVLGNDSQSCHLLYVSLSDRRALQQSLENLSNSAVLTVSAPPDFLTTGGMVYLFVEESKIRFDINLAAARHSQLAVSSALLRLARNVEGK